MKIQLTYDRPIDVKTDLLAVLVDKDTRLHDFGSSTLGEIVEKASREFSEKRLKRDFFTGLGSPHMASHFLVGSTSLSPAFNIWENVKIFVARALKTARDLGVDRIAIVLNTKEAAPFIGKATEGAVLGSYTFEKYRKEKRAGREPRVDIVANRLFDVQNKQAVEKYQLVSEAINGARDLVNEPGSVVTPEYLADVAAKIAKRSGLDLRVWDEKKLAKDGYSGLLQVGKGSKYPPRMIRLAYRTKKAKYHLALVGKGITFDTGGISLKPAEKMFEMKGDMAGGAAVLAAMDALGRLKPEIDVTGIVTAAENFPDANAQRPGDIFWAKNGKSIMVDNTDAEGRLVLTDGLHLAGVEKATHIIDIATLTGSVVRALGPSIAGVMGNDSALVRAVIASGQNQGESFWELPLPEEYKDMLKTPYADINNVGGPLAGALTAGLFLKEFVPENTPWAHLDIAGPFIRDKEWKYFEPGATGFGAKTMADLAMRFAASIGA